MRQYVIDAFTDHVFAGNPAAVCVMDKWLDEEKMMAITIENNLSETAFAVKEGEKLGEVGETGMATGPHLHFELHDGGTYLNPIYYVASAG